jgi:hypothetical protein
VLPDDAPALGLTPAAASTASTSAPRRRELPAVVAKLKITLYLRLRFGKRRVVIGEPLNQPLLFPDLELHGDDLLGLLTLLGWKVSLLPRLYDLMLGHGLSGPSY